MDRVGGWFKLKGGTEPQKHALVRSLPAKHAPSWWDCRVFDKPVKNKSRQFD